MHIRLSLLESVSIIVDASSKYCTRIGSSHQQPSRYQSLPAIVGHADGHEHRGGGRSPLTTEVNAKVEVARVSVKSCQVQCGFLHYAARAS